MRLNRLEQVSAPGHRAVIAFFLMSSMCLLTQLNVGIAYISLVKVLCSVLSVLVFFYSLSFFNIPNVYLKKAIGITIY